MEPNHDGFVAFSLTTFTFIRYLWLVWRKLVERSRDDRQHANVGQSTLVMWAGGWARRFERARSKLEASSWPSDRCQSSPPLCLFDHRVPWTYPARKLRKINTSAHVSPSYGTVQPFEIHQSHQLPNHKCTIVCVLRFVSNVFKWKCWAGRILIFWNAYDRTRIWQCISLSLYKCALHRELYSGVRNPIWA